jgi:2-oxoglutarate ferredoxin oxidoreductase subunit delta
MSFEGILKGTGEDLPNIFIEERLLISSWGSRSGWSRGGVMAKTKGIVLIETDRCKGCGLCIAVCPTAILFMDDDVINVKGYQPAAVSDMSKCIGCGYCALVCPDVAIHVERLQVEREEPAHV